jgi:hypothetical protein
MINPTGTITVNGITDSELVKILEIKMRHEGHFTFNPQQLQPQQAQRVPGRGEQFYNNANFTWTAEPGLSAVHEILGYLLKKEERREAAANQ